MPLNQTRTRTLTLSNTGTVALDWSIAEAGGTTPVIVEATDDLAAKFADGLEGIRAAAAPPCSYSVPLPPNGEALNLNLVNVVLVPQDSGPEAILNVAGPDECEFGGWYYDPPDDPQSIELCPNTCDVVSTPFAS